MAAYSTGRIRPMSKHPRFRFFGTTAIALVVGLAAGAAGALAAEPTASAVPPVAAPSGGVGAPSGSVPSTVDTAPAIGATTGSGVSGGAASAGSAIAYPYFGGTPGIAPDHTIVVTGVGQADV